MQVFSYTLYIFIPYGNFFIALGYCYKEQNSSSIKEVKAYVLRKMKNLWIPYVIWTSIYTLLHNLFLKLNIYSNDPLLLKYNPTNHLISPLSKMEILKNIVKALSLHGGMQMGGAFWFIAVLMEISIIYCLFDYFIGKFLKKFICVVGKHTLSIVIFHFLVFKFINYFIVKKYKLSLCLIASYPILLSNGFWWIVYSLLGVSVPVLLSLTWSNLKDGIKNKVRCYYN